MAEIRLDLYQKKNFSKKNFVYLATWYLVSELIVWNPFNVFSSVRVFALRCFGAKIGTGVVIRPRVRIKLPHYLTVGDHTWIGDSVWIDNLCEVNIGSHVCISQGAYIGTGNHRWNKTCFDLDLCPIEIQNGAWICAHAKLGPGAVVKEKAILTLGGVLTTPTEPNGIYTGNPAVFKQYRKIEEHSHNT